MVDWLFYALLALLFWGLWGVFSKVASTHLPYWGVFFVELMAYVVLGFFTWGLLRTPTNWNLSGLTTAIAAGLSGGLVLFFFP